MLTLALLATAVVPLARAHAVLFEQEGMTASVYYDLTNQNCAAATGGGPMWAENHNIGYPFCTGQVYETMRDLGSNSIVAMNWDWVRADPEKWCGKEVQITDADGKLFDFSDGPLFIWDSCEECARSPRVDLSGPAMSELQHGDCSLGLVPGLHVRVLDNDIWKRGALGGRDPSFTGVAGTPEGHGPPVIGPGGAPGSVTHGNASASGAVSVSASSGVAGGAVVTASASASIAVAQAVSPAAGGPSAVTQQGSDCSYGAAQCVNGKSQKCNYVDGVTHETAWVDLGPCTASSKRRLDQV